MTNKNIMLELCEDIIGSEYCIIDDYGDVVDLFQVNITATIYDNQDEFSGINNTVRGNAFVMVDWAKDIALHIIKGASYGVIAHESYHIACRILELNGFSDTNANEEAIAKIIEMLVNEIVKLIK